MAQLEVRGAKRVDVRIARDRVEPEVRSGLARGSAIHIGGAAISVSAFPVPAITRIRTLELARYIITVTAVRVGQEDDAIKVRVAREPAGVSAVEREAGNTTEGRAVRMFVLSEAGRDSKIEVALSHGFEVFAIKAFDGGNHSARKLLVEREAAPPNAWCLEIVIVQVDLRRQASACGARRR